MNCVAISDDTFHEEINPDNIRKLKALRFADTRQDKDYDYRGGDQLIRQGRAALNFACRNEEAPSKIGIEDYDIGYIDGTLYLDCKGNIHTNCDISYKTMDEGEFRIGNVMNKRFDLGKAIKKYNKKLEVTNAHS